MEPSEAQSERTHTKRGNHKGPTSRASAATEASTSAALKRTKNQRTESSCRMLTQPCGCFLCGCGVIIDRGARHHRVVAARHRLVLREAPEAINIYESQVPARVFAAACGGVAHQRSATRKALWHASNNQVAHSKAACPWWFRLHSARTGAPFRRGRVAAHCEDDVPDKTKEGTTSRASSATEASSSAALKRANAPSQAAGCSRSHVAAFSLAAV